MHIQSKFDGGKQINRSQDGSWEGSCTGAALKVNEGRRLVESRELHKFFTT